MKITIEKNVLVGGLNRVGKAIKANSSVQALEGVYLGVNAKGLLLIGSDKELTIATMVPCDIAEQGITLVDYKVFSEIIKKLPNGDIDLVLNASMLEITCKKSMFTVAILNHKDYPEFPTVNKDVSISLPQITLKNMVRNTAFACSQEDTRPILKGLLFEVKDKKLSVVGLDGFRLALQQENVDIEETIEAVVDGKHFVEIIKLFEDSMTEVNLGFTNNHISIDMGPTKVICRLLEGKYVSYNSLLPKENKLQVGVNGSELLDTIERVALVSRGDSNSLVKFDIKDDILMVTSNSTKGKAREELNVSMQGSLTNIEIQFNARYFIEALKNNPYTDIILEFTGSVTPCVISSKSDSLGKYLVLPVRLSK